MADLSVSGRIGNIALLLVNIYAPNWDDNKFFRRLFSSLPDTSSYFIVLGGDFNCWLNPDLDRSSLKRNSTSKSARVIQSYMEELAVSDPWHFLNPCGKAFSFLSHVHQTFTRIDYFF